MLQKKSSESHASLSEFVMPNDTNMINKLMGGRLLHLMDVIAGISAQKHSNTLCVTASVDNVSFKESIALGSIVTMHAQVSRAFNSSMEVYIEVFAENIPDNVKCYKTNEAFYTFVAVNENGKPVQVPELIPETEKDHQLYKEALQRRELRLILAGKLTPKNSTTLQDYFSS